MFYINGLGGDGSGYKDDNEYCPMHVEYTAHGIQLCSSSARRHVDYARFVLY